MPTPNDYDPYPDYIQVDPVGSLQPRSTVDSLRYTPAAYRPPPTPGTLITSGAVPGLISNRAQGTPTEFARRLVAAGVNPPTALPATTRPPPNDNQPQPPAKPENINDPTPPTDKPVTPGQYSPTPWGHPQVAGVPRPPREQPPAPPGVLTPPITSPNNPYWMNTPRGQPAQTPFQEPIQRFANQYGLPPALFNALVHAESGYKPGAVSSTGAIGLGQLEPGTARDMGVQNPYDPEQNLQGAARYLRQMYDRYGSWSKALSAYNRGPGGAEKTGFSLAGYSNYGPGQALIATAAALDHQLVKAGPLVPPPQNYRPVSYTPQGGYPSMFPDRPPSMWGRDEPSMFAGPGSIPHQREIPGILGALAPFLMVGLALFSRGAALPMLSGFAGFMKARAARQDKDAKELKTFYQDKLKETKAKLGLEQGDAAAAMAMPPGPQRDQELQRIALEYGDSQLQAIVANGGDPTALFQQRDKAYQDISKTNSAEMAERRFEAETQWREYEMNRNAAIDRARASRDKDSHDRAMHEAETWKQKADAAKKQADELKGLGVPNPGAAVGGSDSGEQGDGGAKGSDGDGDGSDGDTGGDGDGGTGGDGDGGDGGTTGGDGGGTGEQGAATPSAPTAEPAVASAAPTSSAPPATGGEDQVVDAQGQPIRPRTDVQPAVYRGGAPTAQPAADTSGGAPPPEAPTPYQQWVNDLVNGKELSQLGLPKNVALQAEGDAARQNAQIDALPAGPDYLDKLKAINPNFADFVDGVAHYQEQLPSTRGMLGRDFSTRVQRAAKKLNPHWNYANFQTLQEFRTSFNADKKVGFSMGRAFRLVNATKNLMDDAATMPSGPIPLTTLQQWLATGIAGDPKYNKFASDFRVFATEAMGVATGGAPTVTLTSKLLETLPYGATPAIIRSGIQADVSNSLGAIDSPLQGWHKAFPDEDNPFMFDQNTYGELYRYAHMNATTGELGSELPQVGAQQTWNGQVHVYTGGDPNNPTNWKTQ